VDIFISSQDQPAVKGESVTKFMLKAVVLFALFVAVVAQAQTLPTFRHIVVIFQDNLFGSAPSGGTTCGSEDPFEPGVDIRNGAPDETQNDEERCLTPIHRAAGFDPGHFYEAAWIPQYDGGLMDGACRNCVQPQQPADRPVSPVFLRDQVGSATVFRHRDQLPLRQLHVSNQ
jgi:hypothetical protein